DLGSGQELDGDREGDERRAHDDVDTLELRVAQAKTEIRSLGRALVHLPVAGNQHQSAPGMIVTPGSSAPSRNSSAAPPPVESHETLSTSPSSARARAESAPPTTECAVAEATASATAFVPSAKRGHSKTPIGPFQKIVRASAMRSAKSSRVSGPMSSPSQPSGIL